jgi:hypothetical protein
MSSPSLPANGKPKKKWPPKPALKPAFQPLPAGVLSLDAFLHWSDQAIRQRYDTLELARAIDEHSQIRRIHDLAGKVLQERVKPEEDKCIICGAVIPEGRHGVQIKSWRDAASGLYHSGVICSIPCVQEHNKRQHGLAELIK